MNKFTSTDTYITTPDLELSVNAAITLEKPLLIKGEPGTGKTLLAEEIPGEIYQVKTVVPDGKNWKEGDPVLVEEKVTFSGFEPQ